MKACYAEILLLLLGSGDLTSIVTATVPCCLQQTPPFFRRQKFAQIRMVAHSACPVMLHWLQEVHDCDCILSQNHGTVRWGRFQLLWAVKCLERNRQKQFQRTAAFSLTTETYPASYSSIQSAILSLGDKRPYFIIEHAKLKLLNHCKVWLYSQLINWPACCPRRRIQKWRKRTSDTIESFPLKGSNGSNKAPRVITHSHMTNRMFQQMKISRLWWRFKVVESSLVDASSLKRWMQSRFCQFVKIECVCNIFPARLKTFEQV